MTVNSQARFKHLLNELNRKKISPLIKQQIIETYHDMFSYLFKEIVENRIDGRKCANALLILDAITANPMDPRKAQVLSLAQELLLHDHIEIRSQAVGIIMKYLRQKKMLAQDSEHWIAQSLKSIDLDMVVLRDRLLKAVDMKLSPSNRGELVKKFLSNT